MCSVSLPNKTSFYIRHPYCKVPHGPTSNTQRSEFSAITGDHHYKHPTLQWFLCILPFLPSFPCMITLHICLWTSYGRGSAGDSSALREFTALRGGGMGPLQSRVVRAITGKKISTQGAVPVQRHAQGVLRPHTRGH